MITEVCIIKYSDHWCLLVLINGFELTFNINLN
jgi:hypothetical protein